MSAVTVNDDGLVLRLYIQPKASRDSIAVSYTHLTLPTKLEV